MPTVGVVYDQGAAGIRDVVMAARGLLDVVYLLPDTETARASVPMLEALNQTYFHLTDDFSSVPRLDGVTTFSDAQLSATASIAARQGLRGHTLSTAARLRDKSAQREALGRAGLSPVKYNLSSELPSGRGLPPERYPVVVKPLTGDSSTHTSLARDDHELQAALRRSPLPMVIEELLVGRSEVGFGDHFSVETVSQGSQHVVLAVTAKFPLVPPFREQGNIWPPPLRSNEVNELAKFACACLDALEIVDGLSHVELKLTSDGPRLIEVNGRLGGHIQELASRASGADLVRLGLLVALGGTPLPQPLKFEGVHYTRGVSAPLGYDQFVGVDGSAAVDHANLGLRHFVLLTPGSDLRRDGGTELLSVLRGSSSRFEEMFRSINAALRLLDFNFRDSTGAIRKCVGTELLSLDSGPGASP